MLLFSMSFYAQIVVSDVFPTRVTKSSVVTIIGDLSSGFTNSTDVYLYGISIGSVEATPDGSELSFEITLDGTADISSELKIGGSAGQNPGDAPGTTAGNGGSGIVMIRYKFQ